MMDTVAAPQLQTCSQCGQRHTSNSRCFAPWSDNDFRRAYPPGKMALAWRRGQDEPQEVKILTAAHNGMVHIACDGETFHVPTGNFISAEMSAKAPETSMPATATRPAKKKTAKKKPVKIAAKKDVARRIDAAHEMTSADICPSMIKVVQNDRKTFDHGKTQELADSIKRNGILQPLVVCVDDSEDGGYLLIAGERRWRAAMRLNLATVPVRIRKTAIDSVATAEARLDENVNRVDLDPIERAIAVQNLLDKGKKQKDVATILGCNASQISNMTRLLQLPDIWQKWVAAGKIAPTAARALIPWTKRPQVLQKLVDKYSTEIYEGEFSLHEWSIQTAVEQCTRPMKKTSFNQYSKPQADQCFFSTKDQKTLKALDIETIDGEEVAWRIDEWQQLNAEPLRKMREKYNAEANKRGGTKKAGKDSESVDESALAQLLSAELSVTLSNLISPAKHKLQLPAVLYFLMSTECYNIGEAFDCKKKHSFPNSDEVVARLVKTPGKDIAKLMFATLQKYFGEVFPADDYRPLSEVLNVANILGVDLSAGWLPTRELLALYPVKQLRAMAAKVMTVKEAEQPKGGADLLHWLEEDWPVGTLPAEVAKLLK